ncbi:hypothetical protein QYE76_023174 [Lolium multiflorum]|uniref:Transposase (putative) gypsy type domain-containing protein n=1 Tax=Lolium multiflorum TaxID=4521 RepID=A0AAD8VS04_LOLMU|nr:hypothetical protein QYE76_023174 [Lolium multiflorum]
MPPRPRLTRHNTSEATMAAQDLVTMEWERSKISAQDINLLKKLGLSKKKDALRFPSEERYLSPPIRYRVSFVDHLIRGLCAPIHVFLRGLLFVYGLQLHHLTPNSILHVSIFITICECFLGVHPNWALWKRIFYLRRNGSHNIAYNIGGVVICVRPDVEYFDVKFPDSVQGWRKRCGDEEEEEPAVNVTAPMSMSHTLALSETHRTAEETSTPHPDLQRSTPATSPRASSPKRVRIELGEDFNIAGSSTTPPLDDPLMQPFINLGTQFIGYRNTVNGLKEALLAADKWADDLAANSKRAKKLARKLKRMPLALKIFERGFTKQRLL